MEQNIIMTLVAGFILMMGLITTLGVQNVFVIRQSLLGKHALLAAGICSLTDVIFLLLSITFVSQLISKWQILQTTLLCFGITMLAFYGGLSLYRSFNGRSSLQLDGSFHSTASWKKVVVLALSFSLLNPMAIIDCIVLIGGAASAYQEIQQYVFVGGAMLGSFAWFFGIALCGSSLRRVMLNPKTWRVFEGVSGTIMVGMALKLGIYHLT